MKKKAKKNKFEHVSWDKTIYLDREKEKENGYDYIYMQMYKKVMNKQLLSTPPVPAETKTKM